MIAGLGTIEGAGRRGLLAMPAVAALAYSERLMKLVRPHLPAGAVPVRAIYFDKSRDANWLVPWHQDLTLALRKQVEVLHSKELFPPRNSLTVILAATEMTPA